MGGPANVDLDMFYCILKSVGLLVQPRLTPVFTIKCSLPRLQFSVARTYFLIHCLLPFPCFAKRKRVWDYTLGKIRQWMLKQNRLELDEGKIEVIQVHYKSTIVLTRYPDRLS